MDKRELRREVKRELESLNKAKPETHRELSLQISKHLASFIQNSSSTWILGGFAPLPEEPIWDLELDQNFKERLAYPGDRGEGMSFFHCSFDELVESREFGVKILTPPPEAKEVVPDMLLVPGLAFSKKGERLGRGAGYFDRYLENFKGTRVGVCFELQLRGQLPSEEHDQKVDVVVTEAGIYNRSSC